RTPTNGHVCFTPKSRHVQRTSECRLWAKSGHRGHSFDHLICARYQRLWHIDTERFRGFLVDDQLDLSGLLNRKIGRFLPLENSGGRYPAQTIRLLEIGSVAHETAGDRKLSIRIYGWHCMARRQFNEPITLGQKKYFSTYHKCIDVLTDKDLESRFDLAWSTCL